MLDTKFLKRLIKRKKNKENESSFSFICFEFLHFLIFQTQYLTTPNTQQHHNMKSNPNTECLGQKESQY